LDEDKWLGMIIWRQCHLINLRTFAFVIPLLDKGIQFLNNGLIALLSGSSGQARGWQRGANAKVLKSV